MRSAVYFWLREELYGIADQGDTEVIMDKITAKVNLHADSYEKEEGISKRLEKRISLRMPFSLMYGWYIYECNAKSYLFFCNAIMHVGSG